MISEIAGGYSIIPAIMLSVLISYGISVLLLGKLSIDTIKLDRKFLAVKSFSNELNESEPKD